MPQIRTDEISSIIRQQIESFDVDLHVDEVGTVLEVGDGIARVYGLEKAMASEMVEFENGAFGLALNLEEDSVGVVILGDYLDVREGQTVKRTGRVLSVPAGEGAHRPGRQPAVAADRRQGPDRDRQADAHRGQGPRHRRPAAGARNR